MTTSNPPSRAKVFQEHERVRLLRAFPDVTVAAGSAGTIVFVYEGVEDYEVEILETKNRPVVLTVESDDIALVEE